jgi:peroxiredoxin
MSGILAAAALTIVGVAVGWNVLGARPWRAAAERTAMSAALAASIFALLAGGGAGTTSLAAVALALSAFFLFLTFMSRLPHQEPAVVVGKPAHDFHAVGADGEPFRFSRLDGTAVLLKFYRGAWCPYCVAELRDFDALASEFAAAGVRIVAISPDRLDELRLLARRREWRITLLSDPANEVAGRYNVQNRNFTPKRGPFRDLVIPTSILVDAGGTVRWIDQAKDFRRRAPASHALAVVRALLAEADGSGRRASAGGRA